MPEEEKRWAFYVDESGLFGDDDDDAGGRGSGSSVVAGILVPEQLLASASSIEENLKEANPYAPWPHHAWYTHSTTMFALWSLAGCGTAKIRSTALARSTWQRGARRLLERCLDKLAVGRELKRWEVRRLESGLAGAGSDFHAELSVARSSAISQTTRAIETLARTEPPGNVNMFAALDDDASYEQVAGTMIVDPYLRVLSALLQRVAYTLLLRGGDHTVKLLVLERDVLDSAAATEATRMKRVHVAIAAQDASSGNLRLRRTGARVRFQADCPYRYRGAVHPLHVVADYVAFGARKLLSRRWPLWRVAEGLPPTVGLAAMLNGARLPLAEPVEELPLIGADGAARVHVATAFRGQTPDRRALAGLRCWVREQAVVMAAALGA